MVAFKGLVTPWEKQQTAQEECTAYKFSSGLGSRAPLTDKDQLFLPQQGTGVIGSHLWKRSPLFRGSGPWGAAVRLSWVNAQGCPPWVGFAGASFGVALGRRSLIQNHTVWPVEEKGEKNFMQNMRCLSDSRINFLVCSFPALDVRANSRSFRCLRFQPSGYELRLFPHPVSQPLAPDKNTINADSSSLCFAQEFALLYIVVRAHCKFLGCIYLPGQKCSGVELFLGNVKFWCLLVPKNDNFE